MVPLEVPGIPKGEDQVNGGGKGELSDTKSRGMNCKTRGLEECTGSKQG